MATQPRTRERQDQWPHPCSLPGCSHLLNKNLVSIYYVPGSVLGSGVPWRTCAGELPYREDGICLSLGTYPSGLSVPNFDLLGPLLLLHQTTMCLFQTPGTLVPLFVRPQGPMPCSAQSAERSWVARAPKVGRLEGTFRRSRTGTLALP